MMKRVLIFFLLFSSILHGKVKVGDLILISYRPCRACQVIESETESKYSHIGLVLKIEKDKILVADSLGEVRSQTLEKFIQNANIANLYRITELSKYSSQYLQKEIMERYLRFFKGLSYDNEYLWDNYDAFGAEKLYCSEFITKLLAPYMTKAFDLQPMSYVKNMKFWVNYFKPFSVPQDLPGNNPGKIAADPRVEFIEVIIEEK